MERDGLEAPTGFEIETAMAFLAFKKRKCDIVILEVGLGGREDATNIIKNTIISVITPVSMDHMGILGNTIEQIASEKAGIIREHIPVVTCQQSPEAAAVISDVSKKKKSPCIAICQRDMELIRTSFDGFDFIYKGKGFHSRMAGTYQMENASTAIEVCRQMPDTFPVAEEKIESGIAKAFWHGRFEVVCKEPVVVIDGAHNESGALALADSIRTFLPSRKIHGVMGVFKDKEYEKIVSALCPVLTDVIVVAAPTDRGLSAEKLQTIWECITDLPVKTADSIGEGVKAAIERCKEQDAVVVFGSLSLLSHCSCGKIKISV
jgi:dihydrofolate synthase/folylpolyglutamate synthase